MPFVLLVNPGIDFERIARLVEALKKLPHPRPHSRRERGTAAHRKAQAF